MDLSAISTADLLALKAGDVGKVSTEGLLALRGQSADEGGTVGNVLNNLNTGIVKGIPNAIDAAGALVATGAEKLTGGDRTFSDFMHGGGVVSSGMDKLLGTKEPEAKSNLAKYARAAGEGIATSVLTPGASLAELAGNTARGAMSGVGSQAGGDVGEKVGGDKGRVVGSILGGVAGGYSPEAVAVAQKGAGAVAKGTQEATKNIAAGFGRKSAEEWGAIGNEMKASALNSLEAANKNGTVIAAPAVAEGTQGIIDAVRKDVNLDGATSNELYPKTKAFLADLSSYQGGDLSLEQVHQLRQVGSSLISKAFRDGSTDDAYKLADAVGKLDDWVSGLDQTHLTKGSPANIQTFNDFRDQYSQFARFDKVQKLLEFSHGDINKVRSAVLTWFKPGAEKKLAGYSDAQKALLHDFAFESKGEQILKLAGKLGVNVDRLDKSNLGSIGTDILLGIASGAHIGGGALVAGTVAKTAANRIAQGKLETSLKSLSGR